MNLLSGSLANIAKEFKINMEKGDFPYSLCESESFKLYWNDA